MLIIFSHHNFSAGKPFCVPLKWPAVLDPIERAKSIIKGLTDSMGIVNEIVNMLKVQYIQVDCDQAVSWFLSKKRKHLVSGEVLIN